MLAKLKTRGEMIPDQGSSTKQQALSLSITQEHFSENNACSRMDDGQAGEETSASQVHCSGSQRGKEGMEDNIY